MAPVLFEAMIPEKMPHLDLVIYPICPTTAIPSTYPVADSVPSLQSLKIGMSITLSLRLISKIVLFITHPLVH